jgi:RNA recognition motif-containing protein
MSIYVGNLSYEVTQEDLTSVFAEYGSVKRVQLPTDRETGRLRGFGFVEMGSEG